MSKSLGVVRVLPAHGEFGEAVSYDNPSLEVRQALVDHNPGYWGQWYPECLPDGVVPMRRAKLYKYRELEDRRTFLSEEQGGG